MQVVDGDLKGAAQRSSPAGSVAASRNSDAISRRSSTSRLGQSYATHGRGSQQAAPSSSDNRYGRAGFCTGAHADIHVSCAVGILSTTSSDTSEFLPVKTSNLIS